MTIFRTTLIITAVCFLVACNNQQSTFSNSGASASSLAGKLIVTGSSTIAPLAAELAKQFESMHSNVKIDVQTGGSSRGISDVRQQISDIGMVSRQLKAAETDLSSHLLAKDGVSIIVHKNNPISELSEQQIKQIYLGEITNWKKLGGHDVKITVINKAEGRSTLEVFLKHFQLKNTAIKPTIIIGDNEQAIKLVANNTSAIAYVSIGTAEYDIALNVPIRTLPLNGIEASTKTVLSNQFPLSRELNLITKGELSTLSKAFIEYTRNSTISSTIEEFGFVPVVTR